MTGSLRARRGPGPGSIGKTGCSFSRRLMAANSPHRLRHSGAAEDWMEGTGSRFASFESPHGNPGWRSDPPAHGPLFRIRRGKVRCRCCSPHRVCTQPRPTRPSVPPALPAIGLHRHHGNAQPISQMPQFQLDTATGRHVEHVDRHDRGQAQLQDLADEVPVDARGWRRQRCRARRPEVPTSDPAAARAPRRPPFRRASGPQGCKAPADRPIRIAVLHAPCARFSFRP